MDQGRAGQGNKMTDEDIDSPISSSRRSSVAQWLLAAGQLNGFWRTGYRSYFRPAGTEQAGRTSDWVEEEVRQCRFPARSRQEHFEPRFPLAPFQPAIIPVDISCAVVLSQADNTISHLCTDSPPPGNNRRRLLGANQRSVVNLRSVPLTFVCLISTPLERK